jgi:hypothetical protein
MPCGELGNDEVGDCTCAAAGHEEQVATANHGHEFTPTTAQILADYSAITGYDPNAPLVEDETGQMVNPTDKGADMLTVLKYWRSKGIAGREILAFAKVAINWLQIQQGIALFGSLYTGLALPASLDEDADFWDVPANLTGDNEPGSMGGHCVLITGYTADQRVKLITWGGLKTASLAWLQAYCDELYVVASYLWAAQNGSAPNGVLLPVLLNDLHGLGQARSRRAA